MKVKLSLITMMVKPVRSGIGFMRLKGFYRIQRLFSVYSGKTCLVMAREGIFSDDLVSKYLPEKRILAACETNSHGFLIICECVEGYPPIGFRRISNDPPSLMWITRERANLIDKRVRCI